MCRVLLDRALEDWQTMETTANVGIQACPAVHLKHVHEAHRRCDLDGAADHWSEIDSWTGTVNLERQIAHWF